MISRQRGNSFVNIDQVEIVLKIIIVTSYAVKKSFELCTYHYKFTSVSVKQSLRSLRRQDHGALEEFTDPSVYLLQEKSKLFQKAREES